jgi:hypothetical protein
MSPPVAAVDSDGDGVDDGIDCRPVDPTTWDAPTEATNLALSGKSPTSFQWSTPASPGGTAILYDLIRSTSPSNFDAATCLVSNGATTAPAFTDAAVPSPAFFYLVRSKTACGGTLGTKSPAIPRTGAVCAVADGGSCAIDAECASASCCSGICRNLQTDTGNCGSCGQVCIAGNGTTSCLAGTCTPICNTGWDDCLGPNQGCQTNVSNDVANCGGCGSLCPGTGQTTGDAFCVSSSCGFTCRSENYDVDNNPADGCEVPDSPTGNHIIAFATSQGSRNCIDSNTFSFGGKLVNDTRTHDPLVNGFDVSSGSAPDYLSLSATGGLCINDLSVQFQTSGGSASVCYKLTVNTNSGAFLCTTSGSGSCMISQGSGAYANGTTIFFKVERTCPSTPQQNVNYIISGHL